MLTTYDPSKVSVIVGSQPVTGYADGDFVSVERSEESFSLLVGADGETTRAKNANKSGKIKITLMASSASNDYLSALQAADELGGNSPFPILIKDNSGKSLYTAATAWISKPASGTFGKEAGKREWEIATDELICFAGGQL